METTTIQLSKEMKEKLATFGSKNETYDVILKRVYNLAVKEQLRDFLMNADGFISLEEFKKEIEKEWPR
jgi:predicted CopG family antitoxin